MNVDIREDSRTLREFYPEPTLRHQVHYAFAHQFLPQYVQQNPFAFFSYLYNQNLPGGPIEPTRFIHSRWSMIFLSRAGLEWGGFRRVTDLSMSIQELGGRASALVQMPPPEESPEAYFVCVVSFARPAAFLLPAPEASSCPHDFRARVFTLEAHAHGDGNNGLMCEWTKEAKHENFGVAVPADRIAFLSALESLLASPNMQSRGG